MSIFDKNYGLTPLEKGKFGAFLNRCFIVKKVFSFFPELHQLLFNDPYCIKTRFGKCQFLTKNHGLTPLEKCKFAAFLDRCVYSQTSLHFLSRT